MLIIASLICQAVLIGISCFAAVVSRRSWAGTLIYGASAALCAAGLVVALAALASNDTSVCALPLGIPWLGVYFRLDALSAVFLAVVNFGGTAASVFAIGYGRHEESPQRVLPFVPAFLAAMNLVVVADDAFAFLLSWECMSLLSWALVVSHDRAAENLRAGLIYVVMAGFGTLALLICFAILAGGGDLSFASMRAHGLNTGMAGLVLALALLGAGSKAGVFPLHAWLPLAHPAAPGHVSALMSGVMTKVAVYGFIRIAFDLMGVPDATMSLMVIVVGAITAALGVLYALLQNDLKRLLAYSTVENIGIIFVVLGLAMAFRSAGQLPAAALAATAALFHVFNHSMFKSLLFFGSGAIQNATGERDMDRLGGLIRTMPQTSLAFLVGAAAISALPPLNGFASEWMIFQAAFQSAALPQWGMRLAIPSAAAVLALSAALAAACFVKAFGVTFLGRPRSAIAAHETDKISRLAMFGLAAGCVLAGLVPGLFTNLLGPATHMLTTASMPASELGDPLVPVAGTHNTYSGLAIAVCVLAAAFLVAILIKLFANGETRRSDTWDCGHAEANTRAQYSAGSFAQPIRCVYATLVFRARELVGMPTPGDPSPATFEVKLHDPAWELLYLPVGKTVGTLADRFNPFQYLTIRSYLGIVFLTLVALLTVLAIWM